MFTLFTLIIKHLRVNNNFASLFTLVFKHLRVNNNFRRPSEKFVHFIVYIVYSHITN